jgi:uncharacterized protein (DUF4415 family)
MAKASRNANGHAKSRQAPAAKTQSRTTPAKVPEQPRTAAGSVRAGWATDLVFDVREPKLAVSLRLDADVLRFFRGFGGGYQTRINEVLKAFMQARGGAETVSHAIASGRVTRPSVSNGKRAAR